MQTKTTASGWTVNMPKTLRLLGLSAAVHLWRTIATLRLIEPATRQMGFIFLRNIPIWKENSRKRAGEYTGYFFVTSVEK
jgi:hypothetical protein